MMAWRWIDDKPLSEPMLPGFTDAVALGGDELIGYQDDNHSDGHQAASSILHHMVGINFSSGNHGNPLAITIYGSLLHHLGKGAYNNHNSP